MIRPNSNYTCRMIAITFGLVHTVNVDHHFSLNFLKFWGKAWIIFDFTSFRNFVTIIMYIVITGTQILDNIEIYYIEILMLAKYCHIEHIPYNKVRLMKSLKPFLNRDFFDLVLDTLPEIQWIPAKLVRGLCRSNIK